MKRNRILSVTLACILLSLILVSCSDAQAEETAAQMKETSEETEESIDLEADEYGQLAAAEINEETEARAGITLQSGSKGETLQEEGPQSEAETEEETSDEPETVPEDVPVPQKDEIVRVRDYIPDIMVDLRYATDDNFTGTVIYDFTDAYLRYGTIEKLAGAQEQAEADGYSLRIWDAFRPVSAQFTLWEVYPDGTYVANPNKGYSSHSRGNTVDITLVRSDGTEIPMPTDFDDFSAKADRNYSDCTEEEAANAGYLERIMTENGFTPYSAEWWHFSDTDSYEVAADIEIPVN